MLRPDGRDAITLVEVESFQGKFVSRGNSCKTGRNKVVFSKLLVKFLLTEWRLFQVLLEPFAWVF